MTVADLVRLLTTLPQDNEVVTLDRAGSEGSVVDAFHISEPRYNGAFDRVALVISDD